MVCLALAEFRFCQITFWQVFIACCVPQILYVMETLWDSVFAISVLNFNKNVYAAFAVMATTAKS